MKISNEITGPSTLVGAEKAVEYCAAVGFDAWDFPLDHLCSEYCGIKKGIDSALPLNGDEYLKLARKLRKIGEDNGIVCHQTHAPTRWNCPHFMDCMKRAIEITAEAGAKICVTHPNSSFTADQNIEAYLLLMPFAKEHGVKIALENVWMWDFDNNRFGNSPFSEPVGMKKHMDLLPEDTFIVCLDTGHAEIGDLNTSAVEIVKAMGGRVQALHLQDTDRRQDNHEIPFTMDIPFAPIVRALKENGYSGYFSLEAFRPFENRDAVDTLDIMKKQYAAAKQLAVMFENI
ncbi:MAG: sugar phosphate isomerase/epimerase [Clostridia bacterium]|nr:sugar phosphate isomerase/epimerase [Clostridia bacterium]